ncbi:MAG: AzlC family ABC transporter permease [Actinomycetota bacterium]
MAATLPTEPNRTDRLSRADQSARTDRNVAAAPPEAGPGPIQLGVRDMVPFALSLIPFALAIGSAAAADGLPLGVTLFGAGVLLAGASQLAAIELIGAGAGLGIVLATVSLVNARLLLYGEGLNRWFPDLARWQRLVLATGIVDANYLNCERRFTTIRDEAERRRYYLAGTACLVGTYVGFQAIGHAAGATVPDGLGLHLAAPLCFAGMLAQTLTSRVHLATAGTSAVVLVGTTAVLGGVALPLAAVAALTVGALTMRSTERMEHR